jgi:hypothetical protein
MLGEIPEQTFYRAKGGLCVKRLVLLRQFDAWSLQFDLARLGVPLAAFDDGGEGYV